MAPFAGMALGGSAAAGDGPERAGETVLVWIGRALFVGGWTIGPSLGHLYAEVPGRMWTGVGIRTAGLLVAGLGQAWYLRRTPKSERDGASLLGIAGVLLATGNAAYDVLTAPRSARAYNETHGLDAQVAPTTGPQGEQVGVALRVSF